MNESSQLINRKTKVLITGATGFVGRHLVRRLLKEGCRVHIISRTDSHLASTQDFADLTNHIYDGSTESVVNCIVQAEPDIVIHLASLFLSQHATEDLNALILSNVLFGSQLLEAMKVNQVTLFINTGTSWQHYNNEDYNPVCLYAATKQAFDSILEFYVQAYSIKAITLKLFDTYGPADLRPKLFNLLEKAAKTGDPLDMSAGEQLIDLVHIDDVVNAYLIAISRLLDGKVSLNESYAVSSGYPIQLKKLVETYSSVTGKIVNINWGARPYRFREVMTSWCNGQPIENWSPKISLNDGLNRMNESNTLGLTL